LKVYTKPPLGLIPKDIWKWQKLQAAKEAIERYINRCMRIPDEWLEEYNELIKILDKK